ncbi:MAG: general secretion pathway protein GspK [Alphaproteobacteria bacterium]|uniref:General secretion pathway protein GspK n=1 Tax=Candidatus Nitrobium versatile TaxID=2884831 RepID=A0A953M280_9BACT|nr:general secretion pathway protein GspK [Candidatus Nitrobium versatile]
MRSIESSRGSATLLSLLLAAVVVTVGIGFNWLVKEHLKAAEGLKTKSEATLRALSVYDRLIYSILSGRTSSREVVLPSGERLLGVGSIPLNNTAVKVGDDVEIRIQDSNGMISLSSPNMTALQRLLRNARPGEDTTEVIIDSLLDWIDQDTLVRVNGAEETYYRSEGKPYAPRNYPLQYKEEFAFIRGMDEDLYRKAAPSLTLLPSSGFNPNTAGDEVLTAYLGIGAETLAALKAYMAQKPVASATELFTVTGRTIEGTGEGTDFQPSRFWEIAITVGKPRPVYSLKAGIDVRQGFNQPYSVVYWGGE